MIMIVVFCGSENEMRYPRWVTDGNHANDSYRIYSIKPHGAYLIFVRFGKGLIRGRGLSGGGAYLRHEVLHSKWGCKFSPVMTI